MAIDTFFSVSIGRDIRRVGDDHTGSPEYFTVLELHEWLASLSDDENTSGDDLVSIIQPVPSSKSFETIIELINNYNLDDDAAEYIYNGSIIQDDGDTIYDGIQVIGESPHIEILQNGALIPNAFWNENGGLNADPANGVSHQFMVKVRTAGADIDGRRIIGTTRELGFSYGERLINGTGRGVNAMALTHATDLNNTTAQATIATWTDVVNDNEGFTQIDANGDGTPEDYYSDWELGSRTANEFYERLKWLTRRGNAETLYGLDAEVFRGITHEIDIDNPAGTFVEPESVSWTGGTGQLLAIDSTTAGTKMWIQLLTGVAPTDGQTITGAGAGTADVNVTVTARPVSPAFVGASTGTAVLGAYGLGIGADDLTANDRVTDLTNTQRIPPNNVTFTVNGLVSGEDRVFVGPLGYRLQYDNEASGPFQVGETVTFGGGGTAVVAQVLDLGATGELIIGEMTAGALPADDETITGGTSSATGDVNGDPVPWIDLRQLTLNGALSSATTTSVVVNETIPSDTPSTGTLRIVTANGTHVYVPFTSYTGSTFTVTSTDFSTNGAADGAGLAIGYIDELATGTTATVTMVFAANRNFIVFNRDGGVTPVKPFEVNAALTSAGGSATVVRTAD